MVVCPLDVMKTRLQVRGEELGIRPRPACLSGTLPRGAAVPASGDPLQISTSREAVYRSIAGALQPAPAARCAARAHPSLSQSIPVRPSPSAARGLPAAKPSALWHLQSPTHPQAG